MLPLMPRTTKKGQIEFYWLVNSSCSLKVHLSHAMARPKNVIYLGLEINVSCRETAGSGEDPGAEIWGINPAKWAWNDVSGKIF